MTAPGPPTEHETGHAAAVRAASVWADTLIDKTGRNELLYCKDRGKILLGSPADAGDRDPAAGSADDAPDGTDTRVDPVALARLLRGETVRLRQLFRDEAAYQAAAKTAESIRRRIKEYDEERGVRIGRLAYGFATWTDFRSTGDVPRRGRWRGRPVSDPPTDGAITDGAITDGAITDAAGTTGAGTDIAVAADAAADTDHSGRREIRAPVLLRDIAVTRRHGRDDFEIVADRDVEINPVLLHYLRSTFRVDVGSGTIATLNDVVDDPDRVDEALAKLGGALVDVPELHIIPGVLIGTFHYAKLAMHEDLVDHAETFADSDLVAAMAGDPAAVERIRRPVGEVSRGRAGSPSRGGRVSGPRRRSVTESCDQRGPGRPQPGRSGSARYRQVADDQQLISTFAARGQTVLFVAEKRAAIDAVLSRLDRVGLDDLTLDLHVTTANRTKVYEQFRDALEAAEPRCHRSTPPGSRPNSSAPGRPWSPMTPPCTRSGRRGMSRSSTRRPPSSRRPRKSVRTSN